MPTKEILRSSLFPLHSKGGFAQVILLLFLLAGIAVGTIIIQNRTNFLPRAQDCNPGIDNNCDTGGGSESGDPGAEQAAAQRQEQADLEKGAREAGKSVEEYRVDDCKANPGKPGCSTTSDGQSLDTQSPDVQKNFRAQYCTVEEAAAGKNCDNAKQQWARRHANDIKTGGASEGRPSQTISEQERLANQKEAANRNKATLDATRASLDPDGIYKNEGPGAYVTKCVAAGRTNEDCENRKKVLEEIITAQEAHDYAVTTEFYNIAVQSAAYDQAKLLARTASCDAVAAGIAGSNCVLDLGDSQNIITTSDGKRVFLGCSTKDFDDKGSCRKVLNYRGKDGKIHELSSDEAKALLCPKDPTNCSIAPGAIYDMAQIPTDLRKSAQDLCLATGTGCIAAGQTTEAGATKPNGQIDVGDKGTKISNWTPEGNCPCKNSCTVDQAIACYKEQKGSSIDQLAGAASDLATKRGEDPVEAAMRAAQSVGANPTQIAYSGYNTALARGKNPAQAWDEVKNIIDVGGVAIPRAVSQAASTTNFQSKCTQADKVYCMQKYGQGDCDYFPSGNLRCIYSSQQSECSESDKNSCHKANPESKCVIDEGRELKCIMPASQKECSSSRIEICKSIGYSGCLIDTGREERCFYPSSAQNCNRVDELYCKRIGKKCVIKNQLSTCI